MFFFLFNGILLNSVFSSRPLQLEKTKTKNKQKMHLSLLHWTDPRHATMFTWVPIYSLFSCSTPCASLSHTHIYIFYPCQRLQEFIPNLFSSVLNSAGYLRLFDMRCVFKDSCFSCFRICRDKSRPLVTDWLLFLAMTHLRQELEYLYTSGCLQQKLGVVLIWYV